MFFLKENAMKEFYRKRFFPLFTLFLIPLFALSLFSCSMLEADSPSSSVSFTFSGEFVQTVQGGGYQLAPRLMNQARKISLLKSHF